MQIIFTITIEYLCLKNLLLGCSTLKPQMVETSWWFCFCHIYSPVKLYALDSSTVAVGFHFRLRRKVLGAGEAVKIENRKRFGQKEWFSDIFWEEVWGIRGTDLWVREADIRQLQDLLSLPEGPNPGSSTSRAVPHVCLAPATCIAPTRAARG